MLIRSLRTQSMPLSLSSLLRYSFQLQRQPVDHYFNKNFKQARDQIQKITTEFNMTKEQGRRLFHFYPKVFKTDSKEYGEFRERVGWVRELVAGQDQKGVGKVLNKLMFQSNHVAFTMDKQHFDEFVKAIRDNFESESQIEKILSKTPNLLNPKLPEILHEKLSLLQDYLTLTKPQAMKIFEQSPFLLVSSTRKLRESILVLTHHYGMTKEEIVGLMKVMGEVFLLGEQTLIDVHKVPVKWGLTGKEIREVFLKNPLLFFNYPIDVMPFKRRIFRFLSFTEEMGRMMLKQYPQILICSIRSLQQKALFITNRLQLKLDPKTLQLLRFNFNKILRPRGQILIRSQTFYNKDNIVQYMKLTDEQFMQKVDVPLERLKSEIEKFPISVQLDFKNSQVLKRIGAREKFLRMAEEYNR